MNISWSISITQARMQQRELTIDEFMAAFNPANVRTQPTKDGPNYIAGRLRQAPRQGQHRRQVRCRPRLRRRHPRPGEDPV